MLTEGIKNILNKLVTLKFYLSILTLQSIKKLMVFYFRKTFLRKKIPAVALLALTYKCQCNCVHCSSGNYSQNESELTADEWKNIISQIALLGIPRIHFTGGEPTLRNDLAEIIKFASEKGIICILETNGIMLNAPLIEKLKSYGLSFISISLDSTNPKTHDKLKNYNGAYQKTLQGIKYCREMKMKLVISTYASKKSIQSGELQKLIAFAKENNANAIRILPPQAAGRWIFKDNEILSPQEIKETNKMFLSAFPILNRVKNLKCPIRRKHICFISPQGEVHPCPYLPLAFGNIKKNTLDSILNKMIAHPLFQENIYCLINDPSFREKHLRDIKEWPLRLYQKNDH